MVSAFPAAERVLRPSSLFRFALPIAALLVDLVIWGGEQGGRWGSHVPLWVVVAVGVVAYSSLVVTSTPLLGYTTMWILALAGLWLPSFAPTAGLLVGLYAVARSATTLSARMALVGCSVPVLISTVNGATYRGPLNLTFALLTAGLWSALFIGVWLAGRATARNENRVTQERERAEESKAVALQAEKLRLSRELHDILAHSLTAIIMQAAGTLNGRRAGTVDQLQVDRTLYDIQQAGSQGMRELHRLLSALRAQDEAVPQWDQRLRADDSSAAIADLVNTGHALGFDIELAVSGDPQALDPSVDTAVLRLVQEGVSNAMKYATPGSRVEIGRHWSPGRLVVTVTNTISTKTSPRQVSGGFGLLGLRERMQIIGGTLETRRSHNEFILRATLPTTGAGVGHHGPTEGET